MKASNLRALVPCALLLLFPATAEPMPYASAVGVAMIAAHEPTLVAAAPEPAPAAVHVVLVRGPKRLELELPLDGKVSPTTADEIAQLMRCPTSGRTRRIAAGTLALLADVAARYPGHEIEVVSAVRDEPERTRGGIKHSKHWTGHAIDIIVRGAKLTEVRDAMWKHHHHVGVGWYPASGFIHLDYRPGLHDMAWTQRRPNADNQYHPRWARLARDASLDAAAWRTKVRRLLATSPRLSALVSSIARAMGYDARIARTTRSS